ncbi:MAG: hypothetical protein IJ242_01935 [Clostridia bacterium]|nr:hypothetical protein [Clostridia bacterium]
MKSITGEAKLTFWEAAAIIVGHGVGSGILAVPFLASRNRFPDVLILIGIAYLINLCMHFMIAELSYNNDGAQFVKCFERELFRGKAGKILGWAAFVFLGLSVLINVSGYIAGAAAVFHTWFGLPERLGMVVYFLLASLVVFFGMKLVGISEKYALFGMIGVIAVLFAAVLANGLNPVPMTFIAPGNLIALYSMVAFALSAVMSVPQVVKGLGGDPHRVRGAIVCGTGINAGLILAITIMTLIGAGSSISENGALVDLSAKLGGWVGIVGFIFSLLALSTSFWANTLNLRDIVHEQIHLNLKSSYLAAALPCLLIALLGAQSFVAFTRLAGIIQVLTGIGIIVAYARSRRRAGSSPICGIAGQLPFRILVIVSSVLATAGSIIHVK